MGTLRLGGSTVQTSLDVAAGPLLPQIQRLLQALGVGWRNQRWLLLTHLPDAGVQLAPAQILLDSSSSIDYPTLVAGQQLYVRACCRLYNPEVHRALALPCSEQLCWHSKQLCWHCVQREQQAQQDQIQTQTQIPDQTGLCLMLAHRATTNGQRSTLLLYLSDSQIAAWTAEALVAAVRDSLQQLQLHMIDVAALCQTLACSSVQPIGSSVSDARVGTLHVAAGTVQPSDLLIQLQDVSHVWLVPVCVVCETQRLWPRTGCSSMCTTCRRAGYVCSTTRGVRASITSTSTISVPVQLVIRKRTYQHRLELRVPVCADDYMQQVQQCQPTATPGAAWVLSNRAYVCREQLDYASVVASSHGSLAGTYRVSLPAADSQLWVYELCRHFTSDTHAYIALSGDLCQSCRRELQPSDTPSDILWPRPTGMAAQPTALAATKQTTTPYRVLWLRPGHVPQDLPCQLDSTPAATPELQHKQLLLAVRQAYPTLPVDQIVIAYPLFPDADA